jgi:hypothetical protein
MNVLRTKPGVEFKVIAPGGFVLLAAIQDAASMAGVDLTITSGSDGEHSGPNDPHHRGEAYDVRCHDLTDAQKTTVIDSISRFAGPHFYVFLESPGTENEHIHCQVRKGTVYPPTS